MAFYVFPKKHRIHNRTFVHIQDISKFKIILLIKDSLLRTYLGHSPIQTPWLFRRQIQSEVYSYIIIIIYIYNGTIQHPLEYCMHNYMNQVPFSIKYCIHDCHITIGLELWQYIYSQLILYLRICEWCRPLSSHYARIRSDRKQGDSLVPLSYLGHKKYYFDMPMHLQHPQAEWTSHVNFGAFYSLTRKRSRVPKNLLLVILFKFSIVKQRFFRKGQNYNNFSNNCQKP